MTGLELDMERAPVLRPSAIARYVWDCERWRWSDLSDVELLELTLRWVGRVMARRRWRDGAGYVRHVVTHDGVATYEVMVADGPMPVSAADGVRWVEVAGRAHVTESDISVVALLARVRAAVSALEADELARIREEVVV